MPTSAKRVAANRANARKSTGPRTPEGKARAAQNARKHPFIPDPFVLVRIEDRAHLASLVADAVATYQPINSQERAAVERIALAQFSILRMYALEAGYFNNCLEQAMWGPPDPNLLDRSMLSKGVEITRPQERAFWLATGFNQFNKQSNFATVLLRFQSQAERLYRRAVEDLHRLFKLRDQLPPEKYEEPNEPIPEPVPVPQPMENTAPAPDAPHQEMTNEPNPEPAPPTVSPPDKPAPPVDVPKRPPSRDAGDRRPHTAKSRGRPAASSARNGAILSSALSQIIVRTHRSMPR